MNGLLTPEEVAEKIKVDVQTIRVWLREKKLKGVKIGRIWRIKESDLNAFLEGTPTMKKARTK